MRGRGLGNGRLWKRDGSWVFDYTTARGDRRREVLGSTKREAESAAAEIIAQRNRRMRGLDDEPKDIQLGQLTNIYLADLAARAGAHHVRNVRAELAQILEALPAKTVSELTPVMIVEYRARLLAEGLSPRWANVVICALQAALRWAVRMEMIDRSPIDGVRKLGEGPKVHRYKRRALSETEIAALIRAVDQEDDELRIRRRVPQSPFLKLLLETGLRYGEARQLTWTDLDRGTNSIVVRAESAKSGRERRFPLRAELMGEIFGLRAFHWTVRCLPALDSDEVFLSPRGRPWSVSSNNFRRVLDRVLDKASIERTDASGRQVDVHALRHTAASRWARKGVPLATTQKLLGHSSPVLTARHYVHLDLDDMRAAIESLGPAGGAANPSSGKSEAV